MKFEEILPLVREGKIAYINLWEQEDLRCCLALRMDNGRIMDTRNFSDGRKIHQTPAIWYQTIERDDWEIGDEIPDI